MKRLVICLFLSFSALAHANGYLTLNVNNQNPSFVITVPANPTTGFQWTVVHYNKNLFTLSHSMYERPKTNLIGAGGQMHFTFMLKKGKTYPESTKIVLKYARSWEPGSASVKEVRVNFVNPS